MRKTASILLLLLAFGLDATSALAQSAVTFYGNVDLGYLKWSGQKLRMEERSSSRFGLLGSEELGGGLKATFQLEQRFTAYDGISPASYAFQGGSNIGLTGSFGRLRFGRINQMVTETFWDFDPWYDDGISTHQRNVVAGGNWFMGVRGLPGNGRQDNTFRWDSASYNGYAFGLAYQLSGNDDHPSNQHQNAGFSALAKYNQGPVALAIGVHRRANSANSQYWTAAAAREFGKLRLSAIYEHAISRKEWIDRHFTDDLLEKNFLIGMTYQFGNDTLNASYQQMKAETGNATIGIDRKFALGYVHWIGKRTSTYIDWTRIRHDKDSIRCGSGCGTMGGIAIGMNHRF